MNATDIVNRLLEMHSLDMGEVDWTKDVYVNSVRYGLTPNGIFPNPITFANRRKALGHPLVPSQYHININKRDFNRLQELARWLAQGQPWDQRVEDYVRLWRMRDTDVGDNVWGMGIAKLRERYQQ